MDLRQFKGLEESVQIGVIWNNGVHVATRDDNVYQYLLYQLDNFYVEVWYHIELEVIHRFQAFEDTERLDPYLRGINIYAELGME
ncbi:MAG TPA: hypothetical protein VGO58_00295 [Chitinophagaceae bacterium]|jgi:hypothetical protein|nr:hypothetical protein [Chitinophagaceae bacterium]